MFNIKYRYIIILGLSVYTYLNTIFTDFFFYYKIDAPDLAIIAVFLLIVFFIWEGNRLINLLLKKTSNSFKHLIYGFLLSLPLTFIACLISTYIIGNLVLAYQLDELKTPTKLIVLLGFRINLFLHAVNTIYYFFHQAKKKEIEAQELKKARALAELQQIKTQINPHFLFNNLNVLSSLILNKSDEANEFIENFAEVYRYILKNEDQELVSIADELNAIKPYIFILKKRFQEAIIIHIKVDENQKDNFIVPAALQMLLENAIKHNILSKAKPLRIEICYEKEFLIVKNNLQIKTEQNLSNKIGLKNINTRYKIISGKEIDVRKTEDTFEVIIPVLNIKNYEVFNH